MLFVLCFYFLNFISDKYTTHIGTMYYINVNIFSRELIGYYLLSERRMSSNVWLEH